MTQPLQVLLFVGRAGVGKDAACEQLAKHFKIARIALADPLKEFAYSVFGFSRDQLWGPSAFRNAPDPKFVGDVADIHWQLAIDAVRGDCGRAWLDWVLPPNNDTTTASYDFQRSRERLISWLLDLKASGKQITPRLVLQTLGTEWGRAIHPDMWVRVGLERALIARVEDGVDMAVITDGRFLNEVVQVRAAGGRVIRIVSPNTLAPEGGVANHASETEQDTFPPEVFDHIIVNDKQLGLQALESAVLAAVGFSKETT